MKTPFIQPRFDGDRFEDHTLPLEVTADLMAYQTLVVELAKLLYRADHSHRQRLPKGFGADFQLHIEKVDDGSARPLLSIVTAGTLALGEGQPYFERARDLVELCIASPDGSLPADFPKDLLSHFNRLGRSLKEGEKMELGAATLTPYRRKHLVLAADKTYERDIEICGSIEEVDWKKSTFRLRSEDGKATNVPMAGHFHDDARKYGGKPRDLVSVKCSAAYDSYENLQRVIEVKQIDVQTNYKLFNRFEELAALEDGWLDGDGVAPDKQKLVCISEILVGSYPGDIPIPAIFPTPDGNLLLEWQLPGEPSCEIDLEAMVADFHIFSPNGDDFEHVHSLSDPSNALELMAYLSENLPSQPA